MLSTVAHARARSVSDARIPLLVLFAAVTATAAKFYLAATTLGTNDIIYWTQFAAGVEAFGPIGIYGNVFEAPYNHPPLAGWWLLLLNAGQDLGLSFALLIRIPAIVADVLTCWLVFRLLSERTSLRVAGAAAAGLVWSPVLVVVSGFHGNTDPVFVALTISSFYLLTRKDRPLLAGLCLGLAVSIKLVPLVAIPFLLFLALRRGPMVLLRFALGGTIVLAVLWVPVVVKAWPEFYAAVLGYRGIPVREWGIAEFLQQAGYLEADVWLAERGSWVVVIAALVPFAAWLHRRSAHWDVVGLGLALVSMLLLTPAFGMQYLSWALAAAYLLSIRMAWFYNIAASLLVLSVYSMWSGGGPPWRWEQAWGMPFTIGQLMLMAATWTCLLLVWIDGLVAPARVSTDTTRKKTT
ncbi:glycosyltransferase 87 family protein [Nocardioides sp.]|uniref:glycosyltransferase 87 family protein n=1 Tax=Nocardioides sp. TaxID=35761 RepID=UPI002D7E7020|nr:glycosyltransferase 87 family protein [Nocardioides sp.]